MLWLVTPVHGREALTRLCFEQRARMLAELATLGVEARQLVVGRDGNMETARELGFETLRSRNVVGQKVNDGFEWACREGGATHVAYCGSDDWHLAAYFASLPAPHEMRTSRWQAFVPPAGNRLVVIRQTAAAGSAPWIIPRELIEPCGYRPADSRAMKAVDASISTTLLATVGRPNWPAVFAFDDGAGHLRMVDFKAGGEQITPWERVVGVKRPRELDTPDVWATLATAYPVDLVDRMERFYAEKEAP